MRKAVPIEVGTCVLREYRLNSGSFANRNLLSVALITVRADLEHRPIQVDVDADISNSSALVSAGPTQPQASLRALGPTCRKFAISLRRLCRRGRRALRRPVRTLPLLRRTRQKRIRPRPQARTSQLRQRVPAPRELRAKPSPSPMTSVRVVHTSTRRHQPAPVQPHAGRWARWRGGLDLEPSQLRHKLPDPPRFARGRPGDPRPTTRRPHYRSPTLLGIPVSADACFLYGGVLIGAAHPREDSTSAPTSLNDHHLGRDAYPTPHAYYLWPRAGHLLRHCYPADFTQTPLHNDDPALRLSRCALISSAHFPTKSSSRSRAASPLRSALAPTPTPIARPLSLLTASRRNSPSPLSSVGPRLWPYAETPREFRD